MEDERFDVLSPAFDIECERSDVAGANGHAEDAESNVADAMFGIEKAAALSGDAEVSAGG